MQEPIPQPSYEEIAATAFLIWEKNGRPHGRDVEFWLQAEQSLKTLPPPSPPVAVAAPAAAKPRRNGPVFDKMPGKRGKKPATKVQGI